MSDRGTEWDKLTPKYKYRASLVKKIPIPEYMLRIGRDIVSGYYGDDEGLFEYKPVERCPLHNEDTASFRYYEETNTCYCFGCQFGGSVLALHREMRRTNDLEDLSLEQAIDELYEDFISHSDNGEENYNKAVEEVSELTTEEKVALMLQTKRREAIHKQLAILNTAEKAKVTPAFMLLDKFTRIGGLALDDANIAKSKLLQSAEV